MNDEILGHTNSYANYPRNRMEYRMMFHKEKFKVLEKNMQAATLLNLAFNGSLGFRKYPVLIVKYLTKMIQRYCFGKLHT